MTLWWSTSNTSEPDQTVSQSKMVLREIILSHMWPEQIPQSSSGFSFYVGGKTEVSGTLPGYIFLLLHQNMCMSQWKDAHFLRRNSRVAVIQKVNWLFSKQRGKTPVFMMSVKFVDPDYVILNCASFHQHAVCCPGSYGDGWSWNCLFVLNHLNAAL